MSFDRYLARTYDASRYNCLHFARDVWRDLTGVDIGDRLAGLFDPSTRDLEDVPFASFRSLLAPENPCLVFLARRVGVPHVGVFAEARVLHLCEAGARFQELELLARGFSTVRFYA